jgi:PAS domain S-box-containing protein
MAEMQGSHLLRLARGTLRARQATAGAAVCAGLLPRAPMPSTDPVLPPRGVNPAVTGADDRWRLAVMGLNVGIWEFNFTTQESFYSPRWKEMIGHSPDELTSGRDEFFSRLHPEDRARVEQAVAEYLGHRSPAYLVECRLRCKDGGYKWIRSRGQAQFDAAGRPLRIVGTHEDIDTIKHAETALHENIAQYRALFDGSPSPMYVYDRNTLRFVTVNEAALRAYGFTQEEFAQMTIFDIRPPEEAERLRAALDAWTPGSARNTTEIWRHRRKDGSDMFVQITSRDHNHGGWPNVLIVAQDVTERVHAQQALAAEHERLAVTLHAMAEGVVTTDAAGAVQFLNEAAEELTGWTAAAAAGRPVGEVCAFRHEATRAEVPAPVAEAMAGHRFSDLPPGTVLLGRAGGARLVEGRCAPIHDPDARAVGAVLVLRDVTQRARLEAELARASKLESIGLLAGGIAHDFNNLLTVVMGNLALATLDTPPGTPAAGWVREAERGLARARDLARQLLTFAKGGEPVLDTVNLAEIARTTTGFALHGTPVRAVFIIEDGLWAAKADRGQLGQVVQNLVLNAAQAMPGGGEVRLALRNDRLPPDPARPLPAGNYLRLEITDTGPGIAPEHLPRVFEPYFTTKADGSGLGLATAYSIVRRHRGHIEAESPPGRGATFRCWLPAATTEPSAAKAESVPPFVAAPGSAGRLLFMDDEEPIRLMAAALLGRLGFAVQTAPDGEEVLRHYQEARTAGSPFDLVIMDLTVPGRMGGKETMAHLLKLDPAVKAIVSSGYSSDPVMANHRAHGFRGMVPKPYKLADLAKAVRAVLAEPA